MPAHKVGYSLIPEELASIAGANISFTANKLVNGTSRLEGQQRERSTGLVGRCDGKDTEEEAQWFSSLRDATHSCKAGMKQ